MNQIEILLDWQTQFLNLDSCQKLNFLPIFLVFEELIYHLEITEIKHVLKMREFRFVRYFLKENIKYKNL